jgi:hypothetical protein
MVPHPIRHKGWTWGQGEHESYLRRGSGRESPDLQELARIQPADGWSMEFQGESGSLPLVMEGVGRSRNASP